ncbi:hypothetical protein BG011_008513 [Mortierella polycephala]|uniref:Uncharacterized protein n=1 Tax=Mortierella polycephala TaxID=41804 RepID=A0A9P6PMW6_9FUNG|nr:hypothetical protein BG011_008513 [Mortierella polycephala]
MLPKYQSTLPVVATLAIIAAFSSCTNADRVILTIPSNSKDIFQGCDMDVDFQVRSSDMARLNRVQMQVLSADNSVLIENLHSSTQADWDEAGQKCPEALNNNVTTSVPVSREQSSSDSYAQQIVDAINKNLAISNGTVVESDIREDDGDVDNISDNGNETGDDDGSDNKGTEGLSTLLKIVLDQATLKRVQDQTIISVLNEIDDYNVQNNSLTLNNGTTVPMDTLLMNNSTKSRFLQALELSSSTISDSLGEGNEHGPLNSTALIAALHRNNDLIELPTMEMDIADWSDKGMNGTHTNGTHTRFGNGFGRELVQQGKDDDQIQDKTQEANGGSCLRTAISKGITMVVAVSVIVMSTVL